MQAVRVHGAGIRIRGVQVPGEQAADGSCPLGFWFADLGAFGGVNPHQVMEPVPVPAGFLKQVPAGQGCEQASCFGDGGIDERRSGWCADVLAGLQAEQPEGLGWSGREGPVGPGEDGADLRGLLVRAQHVEAIVLSSQLVDQVSQLEMAVSGCAVGGDPQRQRQPAAQPGQRLRGGWFGCDAVAADDPG